MRVHFNAALETDPQYIYAINNLGAAYQRQGKLDEASQQYQRALRINPNYQPAQENLEQLQPKEESEPS